MAWAAEGECLHAKSHIWIAIEPSRVDAHQKRSDAHERGSLLEPIRIIQLAGHQQLARDAMVIRCPSMTEKDGSRGLREQCPREPAKHPFLEAAVAVGPGNNKVRVLPVCDI